MMDNATCLSVGYAKRLVAAYSVPPIVAIISFTLTISIIVKVAAYVQFVRRLALYLSITGIIRALCTWTQLLPVDISLPDSTPVTVREEWEGFCVFGGFFNQYTSFAHALVVVWICVHIFINVVLQRQSRRSWKDEALGILIVTLAPFLFTWEPFIKSSYGLAGVTCWIKEDVCVSRGNALDNLIIALAVSAVPLTLMRLVGVALIFAAIGVLCRRHYYYAERFLQHPREAKIRDSILPLMYPSLYAAVGIGRIIADVANSDSELYYVIMDAVATALFNVITISAPLSLVLQHSFWHEAAQGRRGEKGRGGSIRLSAESANGHGYVAFESPEADGNEGNREMDRVL